MKREQLLMGCPGKAVWEGGQHYQEEGLAKGHAKVMCLRNRHKAGWQNIVTGIEYEV